MWPPPPIHQSTLQDVTQDSPQPIVKSEEGRGTQAAKAAATRALRHGARQTQTHRSSEAVSMSSEKVPKTAQRRSSAVRLRSKHAREGAALTEAGTRNEISSEAAAKQSRVRMRRPPMFGSASKSSIRRFVIMEKAPTRAFSWLKAATTAFTFKTLLRH